MPDIRRFGPDLIVHPVYDPAIKALLNKWRLVRTARILVVVDPSIAVAPVPNGFGISRVIELIRNTRIGCLRFRVDIAQRGLGSPAVVASPSPTQPKYTNFRFDMPDGGAAVIDQYEQIWCFGFEPDNNGTTNDSPIMAAGNFPSTDAELTKLDEWMTKKKGGLFGTGDHHYLGASMCHRIPRLGTMRRWTNADGVPTQFGTTRIDTLRPPSAAFEPGAPGGPQSLDNTPHQGDLTVQPITWLPDASVRISFIHYQRRPHPVLCHPELGPINVMPDHAHEGWCVPEPDLAAKKKFKNEPEYPDAIDGGDKPAPQIIAVGSNLGHPPYNFGKGPQAARVNNPMISVYDGHRAGVGRVATDSTWHHWMDVNIDNIAIANTNDWKKIGRYFQNLAVWLCPPGFGTSCFHAAVVLSHFEAVGFQEYYRDAPVLELGEAARKHLYLTLGPCWVSQFLIDIILDFKLVRRELIPDIRKRLPEVTFDNLLLEQLVLGHMVKATFDQAEEIRSAGGAIEKLQLKELPEPARFFAESMKKAVGEYRDTTRQAAENHLKGLDMLFS
jgi:hypothetical protein